MMKNAKVIGPWHHAAWLHVGGLLAVGFPSDFHLLTVTWNGRGLFDLRTFERTARDDSDLAGMAWLAPDQLSALGIGEFADQKVPIVGLWGGTGYCKTSDGWRLENSVVSGTIENSSLIGPTDQTFAPVPLTSRAEYRAVTFNASGQLLILASSSEVQVLRRN